MIGRSAWTDVSQIPNVLSAADVMAILDLAPSSFYYMLANKTLAVPEKLPRIGKRARYDGAWVRAWLRGELTPDGRVPSRFFASGRKVSA